MDVTTDSIDFDLLTTRFSNLASRQVSNSDEEGPYCLEGSYQDDDYLFSGGGGGGGLAGPGAGPPGTYYTSGGADYSDGDDELRGERIASITGSILEQLDLEASMMTSWNKPLPSSSTSSISMTSLCKSTLLFSPMQDSSTINPTAAAATTFSTDSLDPSRWTQPSNHNYRLAFPENNNNNGSNIKLYDITRRQRDSRSTSIQTSTSTSNPIYICYPSYTLPDLGFLRPALVVPKRTPAPGTTANKRPRPLSCNDLEDLRKRDLSHIVDWPSLSVLLPREVREVLGLNKGRIEEEARPLLRRKCSKRGDLIKRFSQPSILELTEAIGRNLENFEQFQLGDSGGGGGSIASGGCGSSAGGCGGSGGGCGRSGGCGNSGGISGGGCGRSGGISGNSGGNSGGISANGSASGTSGVQQTSGIDSRTQQQVDMQEKRDLTRTVIRALAKVYSTTQPMPAILNHLCPALYSLLSDGLRPYLETIFGQIPNTVWRVVEASIQHGPTAQSLNELVMRINSEQLLVEGPIKFNAFICGLLNLGHLSSWLTFLRTKEILLRSHFHPTSYLFLCNTSTRSLYDQLLQAASSNSSAAPSFHLDIFHQTKVLHRDFQKEPPPPVPPPTSTPKSAKYLQNAWRKSQMKRSSSDERPKEEAGRRRLPKSKTAVEMEKGMMEEREEVAAARPKSLPAGERKFRKLQEQWESRGSKIPRPITSPCRGGGYRK